MIFGEAMLVAAARRGAARRAVVLRIAGFARRRAAGRWRPAALLWQVRSAGQRDDRRGRDARWPAMSRRRSGLPLDPVADDDLPRLAPLLDQARALPRG